MLGFSYRNSHFSFFFLAGCKVSTFLNKLWQYTTFGFEIKIDEGSRWDLCNCSTRHCCEMNEMKRKKPFNRDTKAFLLYFHTLYMYVMVIIYLSIFKVTPQLHTLLVDGVHQVTALYMNRSITPVCSTLY